VSDDTRKRRRLIFSNHGRVVSVAVEIPGAR